jgi:hypothetical protein
MLRAGGSRHWPSLDNVGEISWPVVRGAGHTLLAWVKMVGRRFEAQVTLGWLVRLCACVLVRLLVRV